MSIYEPTRDAMVRLLSTPRLDTYTSERAGSVPRGLDLYRWNLDISMAFFESIHYFEVAFRNTIDAAMSDWFEAEFSLLSSTGGTTPHWLETNYNNILNSSPIQYCGVNGKTIKKVEIAFSQAKNRHSPPQSGHVISEITLGTWVWFLRPTSLTSPWARAIKSSFPPNTQHQKLVDSAQRVTDFRNRIAHHEPIFNLNLNEEYNHLINTAEVLDSRLGWWIDSTSRVSQLLRNIPD